MHLRSAAVFAAILAAGTLVAVWIDRRVEITFHDKTLPREEAAVEVARMPAPVRQPFGRVESPVEFARNDQGAAALSSLAPFTSNGGGLSVTVRDDCTGFSDPDAFEIRVVDDSVTVRSGTRLGGVYGLYHLARRARDGATIRNETVAPRFARRYVDLGAVGIDADASAWCGDDYTHHLRAFQQVLQPEAPYVDREALAKVRAEFRAYVRRMVSFGYNGIVFPGFLEYVDFYAGSFEERHRVHRETLGEMLRYAHEQGLRVVLRTDMLALTEPLENHLVERFGAIDAEDPALWREYARGFEELLDAFPFLEGVMLRIGEAGTVYNSEGWPYYSKLAVKTDEAVGAMLTALHEPLAARGKQLFFRTWSVGIGEVGDMHTNPRTFERVLGDLDLPNLVVSTKYSQGDFGSYLSLNPTLRSGNARRIVEFQARREYEAFNAFPNYVGPLHQSALQDPGNNVDGIWVWTQNGGPQRAGPLSLYPFHGFWQPTDANTYATARLAWDPEADLDAITRSWVRETLTQDPVAVDRLTRILFESREAVLKGLYIGPYARQRVLALGLEPPPMAWVFWDIVSGANAALSTVYDACRDDFEAAVAEGFEAVESVRRMQALAREIDPASLPGVHAKLQESLRYEADLLTTLSWYRKSFLSFYRWLDTGEAAAYEAWQEASHRFQEARRAHEARYADDLDFPAYNFTAAAIGLRHAERNRQMMWAGRLLLALVLAAFVLGATRSRAFPAHGLYRALWIGLVEPRILSRLRPKGRLDCFTVGLVPFLLLLTAQLVFSSFLSPAYAMFAFVVLGALFAALLRLDPARPRFAVWAAVTAPLLAGTALLLCVISLRGPLYFWFGFWTDGLFRMATIAALVFVAASVVRAVFASSRTPLARLLASVGAPLAAVGIVVSVVGLESSLTALNTQLMIMPIGLSLTHGIATHLGVPMALPTVLAAVGSACFFAGRWLARACPD